MIRLMPTLFLLFLSFSTFAETYLALEYSKIILDDDESYLDGSDSSGFGATVGYKFPFFSVEGFVKDHSFENESNISSNKYSTKFDDTILGIGGRLFFMFLTVKAGMAYHRGSIQMTKNGAKHTPSISESESGPYLGGGLNLGLPKLDLFADYTHYTYSSSLSFHELSAGLRFFF